MKENSLNKVTKQKSNNSGSDKSLSYSLTGRKKEEGRKEGKKEGKKERKLSDVQTYDLCAVK